ncbi:MAG: tRNA lysidine(34) synthetase TilS [Pseudomonadota bacterium]
MVSDLQPRQAIDSFLSRLRTKQTLCVGVSGGSDSTALLHLLHDRLHNCGSPKLVAVTVDHGLRASSALEIDKVAEFCKGLGIKHRVMRWTGEKPGSGVQEAARHARYTLLREAALAEGTDAVLSAHTRDDQIETIRMRQRRGMGRGLSGMAEALLYHRDCWILRPLLAVRRAALRGLLSEAGVGWIDDPSNSDRRFERVRIRMEKTDPTADAELLSTIEAMTAARRSDDARLARFLQDNVVIHGDMIAELPQVPEGLSDILQQALALLAALMGGRAYLPGSRGLDHIARFVAGSGPPRVNLSRCVLDRRAQRIFVYRERRSVPTIRIAAGQEAVWDGRYRLANQKRRQTVEIGPMEEASEVLVKKLQEYLPRGVVSRAMRSQPALIERSKREKAANRLEIRDSTGIVVSRYFTHFDQFLPEFDLKVADQCAVLFGLPAYPLPPVRMRG